MTSHSGPSPTLTRVNQYPRTHAGPWAHSGKGVLKGKCGDYTNGKRMGLFRWVSAEAIEFAEEERAGIQDRNPRGEQEQKNSAKL